MALEPFDVVPSDAPVGAALRAFLDEAGSLTPQAAEAWLERFEDD